MKTRRDFIKNILQSSIFLSLIGLGAFLSFREESDEICDFDFVCKNCKKKQGCNLPENTQNKDAS